MAKQSLLRRKRVQRPAMFYNEMRKELAVQGRTEVEYSAATESNMSGVWKRWVLYSKENDEQPVDFIESATASDYKSFFIWVLDNYPGVRKKSSVHQYWRQLKLVYKKRAGKLLERDLVADVNNYIKLLKKIYKLDTSVREKPVLSVDDLLLLLYHHWVVSTAVYQNEEQRILLALLFLLAAYTGCRPCSLVDASVKRLEDSGRKAARDEAIRFYDSADNEEDSQYDEEPEFDEDGLSSVATEELKSVLYEHVTIMAVKVGDRMVPVMFITIIHMKGEDRRPQPKTYRMYQNDNPFLCPIAHMIAVGLHNDAFAASTVRDPEAILRARIPKRKSCRIFRWKNEKLKEPIFREPERLNSQTSSSTRMAVPLRAGTAARYMKRLGRDVGMEQSLSHSCIRRGTGNAVDDAATVAERDQIMGHSYSGIFQFYINPNVKCDVQAAYLDQPSDTALMRVLGNMSLTRDPLAPTRLSPEDARNIRQHPRVMALRQRRDDLTERLKHMRRNAERYTDMTIEEEQLLQLKKDTEAALQRRKKRLRDRAERKARERFFMENDTRELEEEDASLLKGNPKPATIVYALEERALVADMLCRASSGLYEPGALTQRIELIRAMTKLCSRREARRRGGVQVPLELQGEGQDKSSLHSLPLECDLRQCLFCLGDERLPFLQRIFCWSRPAKMMDHIEDHHLKGLLPDAKIACPHPTCQDNEAILEGVSHFKRHALNVHKVKLRIPKGES